MRYRLVADVEGSLFLNGDTARSERDGILFELLTANNQHVVSAAVSLAVPPDRIAGFRSTITNNPPGSATDSNVTIGGDKELRDRLLSALQDLETSLGHTMDGKHIRRIKWTDAKDEFIAENEAESIQLSISSYHLTTPPPVFRKRLDSKVFDSIVQTAPRYRDIQIHRAFFREAMNAFEDGQFGQAFYNFFFVLEDLFADGHTKKTQVLNAFKANAEFRDVIRRALESFSTHARSNLSPIGEMFQQRQCALTVEGTMDFLYDMRGNLFHFSTKGAQPKATPFNQADFRPLALFTMHIVNLALIFRMVQVDRQYAGLPPDSQ